MSHNDTGSRQREGEAGSAGEVAQVAKIGGHVPGRIERERVRHELLDRGGRRKRRGGGRRPRLPPPAHPSASGVGGQDPGGRPRDARALRPRGGGRGILRRRGSLLHPRSGPWRLSDSDSWGSGSPTPPVPVKDVRNLVGGDVLEFAGFRIEGWHTPGHTPGSVCFVTDALVFQRGSRLRGVDRAPRLPELVRRRHPDEPAAVPRTRPTTCRCSRGTDRRRPSGRSGRRTRSCKGFLRFLMELAPPRGTADLLPRVRRRCRAVRAAHRTCAPVRVPLRRDADVRAHGAVRPNGRRDVRRGDEGDVHVRGQGGRSLTLRPENTASVVRAYLPTRTAAVRLSRATTSGRSSVTGGHRRGGCASSGSSASRCSASKGRGRRRGHRAGRAVPSRARGCATRPPPEFDRRRELPARVP